MKIIDRGLIYDASKAVAKEKFACFTWLRVLSDKSILCCFKIGPEKLSPDDNIIVMRSSDGGKTWQSCFCGFSTTFNNTLGSLTTGYISECLPNKLLISCLWVDRTNPELPIAHPVTTGLLPTKYLIAESEDSGSHWSPFRQIDLKPHKGIGPTGRIIRLSNGRLALPYESWKDWDDTEGTQSANLRISDNEGKTWSEPVTIASDPFQKMYFWDNRLAMNPNNGQLVAMFWTYDSSTNKDLDIHIAWAEPDAQKWTHPKTTGISGQIAAPLAMGEKRLFTAYVHRNYPPSIRVIMSEDFGKTWQNEGELVIYESGAGQESGMNVSHNKAEYWESMYHWTFGHPTPVKLGDNTALIAFYGGDKTHLSIHWIKVQV